jgi:hypothetical protein
MELLTIINHLYGSQLLLKLMHLKLLHKLLVLYYLLIKQLEIQDHNNNNNKEELKNLSLPLDKILKKSDYYCEIICY